jgi:hypothetical protein
MAGTEKCVGAVGGREAEAEQQQADGRQHDPDPLLAGDREAEGALGHHGQQDHAAGEDGLDERQRGDGHGGDVEDPSGRGDQHADREQLGGEQGLGGPERMADVDGRRGARSPMLEQEADVRREGAGEREEDAKGLGHEVNEALIERVGKEALLRLTHLFRHSAVGLEHQSTRPLETGRMMRRHLALGGTLPEPD